MKHITIDELSHLPVGEGLILQGCGGLAEDWFNGINELMTEEGILLNGDTFKDVYIFEREDLTNILFSMDDVELNIGKLAMWRLSTRDNFGGVWLSDYFPNTLGINWDERVVDESLKTLLAEVQSDISTRVEISPFFEVNIDTYGNHKKGVTLHLPTTSEELQPLLKNIGMDYTGRDIYFSDIKSIIPDIEERLPDVDNNDGGANLLTEFNYLAARLNEIDKEEREIITSAAESWWHTGSIDELINFTLNLENVSVQPFYDANMFGEYLLKEKSDIYLKALENLGENRSEELQRIIEYVGFLEERIDAAAYGKEIAKLENGVFTKAGYLTANAEFHKIYRTSADIPSEYRLFSAEKPLLAVKDIDNIPTFLQKLYAVTGVTMRESIDGMNALAALRSTRFLLLIDGDKISFAEAEKAYRVGSDSHTAWTSIADTSAVTAFAIVVVPTCEPPSNRSAAALS
jgi:hypothetical protein